MATHPNILAWRIPGTEQPGGLPSVGLQGRTRLKRRSSNNYLNSLVIKERETNVSIKLCYIHTHAHIQICYLLAGVQ